MVTVGLTDHDAVLALGVTLIGVTTGDYSADYDYGIWPWARDELGDGQPEVLPDTQIDFERIAALRPDLILAIYSGITGQEYKTLSRIAPTVAQSGDHPDYGTPGDEMTRVIGSALGRTDKAEGLIADVEDRFAEARRKHPGFEGTTAVYAGAIEAGQSYIETAQSSRVGILTSLGFEIPEEIAGDRFYVEISEERLDLLDHDVLVWEIGDRPELISSIEDSALYRRLDVAREGRDVFIEDELLAGALAFISVLSLQFALEKLVPMLAGAVDGDTETEAAG